MLGPDYERPQLPVPGAFRGAESRPASAESAPASRPSFADLPWFEVFDDPLLQQLVREAIDANYDLQIAAERVMQARAFVTQTRANQFPTVEANADYTARRLSENGFIPIPPTQNRNVAATTITADVFWELDFWGKFARATEAARAELLATEANRRAVLQSVVINVTGAYFSLRELDLELAISRQTLTSREESLRLVRAREFRGVASMVDVRQAESLVYAARETIVQALQLIERQENLISFLLGRNPGPVARTATAFDPRTNYEIPAGIPSELLERRPDLVFAEQRLVAANARIGVAKAALYPSISLSAGAGFQSGQLSQLFNSSSSIWSVVPAVNLPIFNSGALQAGVEAAESTQREALILYIQTVQQAFREVADTLNDFRQLREFRELQVALTDVLRDQKRLSTRRYEGGVTSYLEVLDTERQLFDAELNLARAKLGEALSIVALYRALGGGWQEPAPSPEPVAAGAGAGEGPEASR
jgi:multidrug efflux system outer membrane protein